MPFETQYQSHLKTIEAVRTIFPAVHEAALRVVDCLRAGNKVLWAGNGGSAADAQHLAAEMVGRFQHERSALASVALTTDSSVLTALANDYGFEKVFARQVEALARDGDVLFAISTSGNSRNILLAAEAAQARGVVVIALSGNAGGQLAEHADLALNVVGQDTARIQEGHIFIGHLICEFVENHLKGKPS